MRWFLVPVMMALVACGAGDDTTTADPGPVTPNFDEELPVPEPVPPEGSRPRGLFDALGIVADLRRDDPASAPPVLEKLAEYREEHRGQEAEIEPLLLIARILTDLQRHEEAGDCFLEAATLVKGDEVIVFRESAARAYGNGGRPDRALEVIETTAAENSENPAAWDLDLLLARALLDAGRLDDGFAAIREAKRRRGDNARGWRTQLELAQALAIYGRDREAAKECEPIWKEHPYNPVGQAAGLLLAGIFGRIDRTDEARAILTRIGKIGEGDNSTIARATLDGLDRLGERAPAIPGPCAGGTELRAEALAGRPTVVVFWDPADSLSTFTMRHWARLARMKHRGRYNLVGFALTNDPELLRREIAVKGLDAPQRTMAPDTTEAWGICTVPWVWIVDTEGRLLSCTWPLGRAEGLPEVR